MLSALVALGAVTGTSEGIKASQNRSRKEEHRSRKNNLIVHCPKSSEHSRILEGRRVVLSGDKLYIDTGVDHDVPFGHPFAGYYLPYPEAGFPGLVSTITDEAPIMNWVFVHRDTYELKFGNRQASEGNLTGPFDCTRQDRRLTFAGWEGFCAVFEDPFWAVYFDCDDDRLRTKVEAGTPIIEIELGRRELRTPKPLPPPSPDEEEEEKEQPAKAEEPQKPEQQSQEVDENKVTQNGEVMAANTDGQSAQQAPQDQHKTDGVARPEEVKSPREPQTFKKPGSPRNPEDPRKLQGFGKPRGPRKTRAARKSRTQTQIEVK